MGKIFAAEGYVYLTHWLLEQHGIKTSKSAVFRFSKDNFDKFRVLIKLGMPIKEIVKNRVRIEALGVELVAEQLLDKVAEKNGSLFAYLDEQAGSMKTTTQQTQLDKVKAALVNREPVNSVVMFNANITRLSSIIKRLRDRGYPIITVCDNGNGIARYSLPEGWQPRPPL